MVDFIISVGHTPSGTIGSGAADLLDESNCTREIAPLVVKYLIQLGYTSELLRFDRGNSYKFEDCHVRAKQANALGASLFVEIHLNAGIKRRGDGAEVCVSGNNEYANTIGNQVSTALSSALKIDNRGLKNEPGLIVLKETSMPAILVECMFVDGSNADVRFNADTIAKAIVYGMTGKQVNPYKAGWNQVGAKWWYCTDVQNGYYYTSQNGWKQINGDWYIFDDHGYALQDTWYLNKNDNKWYYLGADCAMIHAIDNSAPLWRWINGESYAFDVNGAVYVDCVTPDGYTVDKNGSWDSSIKRIVK